MTALLLFMMLITGIQHSVTLENREPDHYNNSDIESELDLSERDLDHDSSVNTYGDPKVFSGVFGEIPLKVLESKPGSKVTYGDASFIWYKKDSADDCYATCQAEKQIDCIRYYFDLHTHKCVMMATVYGKDFDSLYVEEKPPWLYLGQFADIPKQALEISPGTELTSGDVAYVWRKKTTLIGCYKACKQESAIGCIRYYYNTQDHKCIMMGKIKAKSVHPAVHHVDKDKGKTEIGEKSIKSIMDSESHVPDEVFKQRRKDVVKTVELLTKAINGLRKINPNVINRVNLVDSTATALARHIFELANYQKQMTSTLTSMNKRISTFKDNLEVVKQSNERLSFKQTLQDTATPEFTKEINELMEEIKKLKTKQEINPTVLKMKKNQQILAEALEAIDSEIAVGERQLSQVIKRNSEWGGRLIAEEEQRKVMDSAVQSLAKTVKQIRMDLQNMHNPHSLENVERYNQIRRTKSAVHLLDKSHEKMDNDLSHAKSDLNHLVKDVIEAQNAAHNTRLSIMALVDTKKVLKMDYQNQKNDMNQIIARIQVVAGVYRNVLSALHNLQVKQAKIMHQLQKFNSEMNGMSQNLLKTKKNLKTSQDFPLLTSMKAFQIKLLYQIGQLKKDLFQIRNHLDEGQMHGTKVTIPQADQSAGFKTLNIIIHKPSQ